MLFTSKNQHDPFAQELVSCRDNVALLKRVENDTHAILTSRHEVDGSRFSSLGTFLVWNCIADAFQEFLASRWSGDMFWRRHDHSKMSLYL